MATEQRLGLSLDSLALALVGAGEFGESVWQAHLDEAHKQYELAGPNYAQPRAALQAKFEAKP